MTTIATAGPVAAQHLPASPSPLSMTTPPTRSPFLRPQPLDERDARCPACGGTACVTGTIAGRGAIAFQPVGLRFWTLGPTQTPVVKAPRLPGFNGVIGERAYQACADCGLVWTHVDAERLRTVVERAGKPPLRAVLAPPLEEPRNRE